MSHIHAAIATLPNAAIASAPQPTTGGGAMAGMPGMAGMAGCDAAPSATLAGGAGQAATGAKAIGGGNDLISALNALQAAVKALADVVAKMAAGAATKVAGAQGIAATTEQYVAPVTIAQTTRAGSKEDTAFESRVLDLINKERAKGGLSALSYNAALDSAAEKHANQMATVKAMAHDGIGDGDPGERIRAEGFRNSWGENVAVGQSTPEQVVAEWMNSPAHKRNIMDPNFKLSGISQVVDNGGRKYWAQEFGA
ncbi:MAG: CAP domain-containing protein [Kineosporiaceae bacterium]|nr:CAP domain-containing protein [Aeromicrobium sp.]